MERLSDDREISANTASQETAAIANCSRGGTKTSSVGLSPEKPPRRASQRGGQRLSTDPGFELVAASFLLGSSAWMQAPKSASLLSA
jgi:hypothetical protein